MPRKFLDERYDLAAQRRGGAGALTLRISSSRLASDIDPVLEAAPLEGVVDLARA